MEAAGDDTRLGPVHMSLYTALLLSEKTPGKDFVLHKRYLMWLSKIRSQMTYYRCMKELHLSGHVLYCPSLDPHGISTAAIRYGAGR